LSNYRRVASLQQIIKGGEDKRSEGRTFAVPHEKEAKVNSKTEINDFDV
jgi:hypothetical protein